MERTQLLEEFVKLSKISIRIVRPDGMRQLGRWLDDEDLFPPVEKLLSNTELEAVYTVSPEHVAFGLIRHEEEYLFCGPAPAVDMTPQMINEALAYIGYPESEANRYARSVRYIPVRDITRFHETLRFISLLYWGVEPEPYKYVDYPQPEKNARIVPIAKLSVPGHDVFAPDPLNFGSTIYAAIIQGSVESIEKSISQMRSIFPPEYEYTLTLDDMHDKFVMALAQGTYAAMYSGVSYTACEALTAHYLQLLRKTTTFRQMVRLFKTMLLECASLVHQTQMIPSDDPLTRLVCRDVENHLHEKNTPTLIAERLGITVSYLCKQFKLHSRKTLSTYINERKVVEAKRLLSEQHMTVTDVAMQMGYSTPNYFSTVFRQITGMTPLQYTQKHMPKIR
ncbi:MAG: helix-turn-helix domain-containing protein [Clostridiales bacterium]|nr:helix-turn-helix domain-containing protein [Clostridiales bacterium]